MKFFSDIRLLTLGLWLGAACFFVAVAQAAFAALPTRELAGSVVGNSLRILNFSGIAIGTFLLLTSLVVPRSVSKFWLWTERFLILIVISACAIGQFVINLMISSVRAQIGRPIDEVAMDDPLRIKFNDLHEYSVWLLITAAAAGLIAFFIVANRRFGPAELKTTNDPFDFDREFQKK